MPLKSREKLEKTLRLLLIVQYTLVVTDTTFRDIYVAILRKTLEDLQKSFYM